MADEDEVKKLAENLKKLSEKAYPSKKKEEPFDPVIVLAVITYAIWAGLIEWGDIFAMVGRILERFSTIWIF